MIPVCLAIYFGAVISTFVRADVIEPPVQMGLYQLMNNETISLGSWTGTVSKAKLTWPRLNSAPASFNVLSSLLTPEEVQSIMNLVADPHVDFDEDEDTVDGMATHEIYLQRSGGIDPIQAIPGKPDVDPGVFGSRLALRRSLDEITSPIIRDRILPYVNSAYSEACGIAGESCHVCHSLVPYRYLLISIFVSPGAARPFSLRSGGTAGASA